jgi:hypothetical protein
MNVFLLRSQGHFCISCGFIVQEMCRSYFLFFASIWSFGSALRTPKSWDNALAEAEITLAKECGNECLAVLHSVVNASIAGSGDKAVYVMNSMSDRGLEQMERAHDLMQAISTGAEVVKGEHAGPISSKDTACGTPAECELRALAVNKCTYGRAALQNAYNSLNVVAHVLASLVSSLCGCVHVEHVSHCILQNVPPMCTFPYTVYSKVFAGSVQAWEAMKASTKSCMMHKGPAIQA